MTRRPLNSTFNRIAGQCQFFHRQNYVTDGFHHHVNHFSERFSISVRVNAGLCLFALLTSLFGRGLIRLPLLVTGLILLFFWGISTLV